MEIPGASSRRSMAMSLGSLLKRFSSAPQSPKGCRYNPESVSLGILSAVMEQTDARLCTVGPLIHSNARQILEVTLRKPFRAAIRSCGLCRRWIGSGTVYMYKGETGFCKLECLHNYVIEQLQKETEVEVVRKRKCASNGG